MVAIEDALHAAEREQSGLNRRVEDVLARAAVTLGNGDDEYLEREPLDSHHHDLFDKEILNGQHRLKELGPSIAHFKFLKAGYSVGFPTLRQIRVIVMTPLCCGQPNRSAKVGLRRAYLFGCAFWCQAQAVRITVARSEWRGTKSSTFRAAEGSATR